MTALLGIAQFSFCQGKTSSPRCSIKHFPFLLESSSAHLLCPFPQVGAFRVSDSGHGDDDDDNDGDDDDDDDNDDDDDDDNDDDDDDDDEEEENRSIQSLYQRHLLFSDE